MLLYFQRCPGSCFLATRKPRTPTSGCGRRQAVCCPMRQPRTFAFERGNNLFLSNCIITMPNKCDCWDKPFSTNGRAWAVIPSRTVRVGYFTLHWIASKACTDFLTMLSFTVELMIYNKWNRILMSFCSLRFSRFYKDSNGIEKLIFYFEVKFYLKNKENKCVRITLFKILRRLKNISKKNCQDFFYWIYLLAPNFFS